MNIKGLLYSFVFLSGFIFGKVEFAEKDLLNADEAFLLNSSIRENKILISWEIKPGYYLYKKSIMIKAGNNVLKYHYTAKNESIVSDKFFGESVIFKDILKLDAELLDGNLGKVKDIKVIYQGCAEGKYCYPKIIKSL